MNIIESKINQTSPVGLFASSLSPYGVMDMSGNVWEWTLTTFAGNDNHVKGTEVRVMRGGSWNFFDENYARSASRFSDPPENRFSHLGGRVVLAKPIEPFIFRKPAQKIAGKGM